MNINSQTAVLFSTILSEFRKTDFSHLYIQFFYLLQFTPFRTNVYYLYTVDTIYTILLSYFHSDIYIHLQT